MSMFHGCTLSARATPGLSTTPHKCLSFIHNNQCLLSNTYENFCNACIFSVFFLITYLLIRHYKYSQSHRLGNWGLDLANNLPQVKLKESGRSKLVSYHYTILLNEWMNKEIMLLLITPLVILEIVISLLSSGFLSLLS